MLRMTGNSTEERRQQSLLKDWPKAIEKFRELFARAAGDEETNQLRLNVKFVKGQVTLVKIQTDSEEYDALTNQSSLIG